MAATRARLVACLALMSAWQPALGQSSGSPPLFHGDLSIKPATGVIEPDTGISSLRALGWTLRLTVDSNGIDPTTEPVLIALGEETFRLQPGALRASKRRRSYRYVASREVQRGIRSLRLLARRDGTFHLSIKLFAVNLSRLLLDFPACVPIAVVVGDDDGFTGLTFDRRSFEHPRLRVTGTCEPTEDWTWLERCGAAMTEC